MNEVFKVAKFKLRLSNRKKNVLKSIMIKYTNAFSEILDIIKQEINDIEIECLDLKVNKKGVEKYIVNTKKLKAIIKEKVNQTKYKNYRENENLIDDVTIALSSYLVLRLEEKNPSYPVKTPYGNKKITDKILNNYYEQLIKCGITENGIEPNTNEKETELAGEISRIVKQELLPIPFLRYRDFTIIEQYNYRGTPKRIALLNIIKNESGKKYLEKYNKTKPKFIGSDISTKEQISKTSVTKIPCVLEWSLFHELNYFRIGTPKTAKLIYDSEKNDFYLHVTFMFLPHVDENGDLHYIKKVFDEKATNYAEIELRAKGTKKKVYKCYDALTGESLDVLSVNKTTHNKERETDTFMGVDLGRKMLAAYAIVKNGKVLYKNFAESKSISKMLYELYEEIAELQKLGKQNRKILKEKFNKIKQLTKNSTHETVNRLVWARDYYNSQLILENLKGLRSIPKKKVQQYKRISDLLTYKSQLKGFKLNYYNPPKAYLEIYPSQTSKLCSKCGYTHEDNRQIKVSQEKFKCVKCGYEINADLNASINIARLGEYNYKFNKQLNDFDEYLVNFANCKNANFEKYRKERKLRFILKSITKLIDKNIKLKQKQGKEFLF